MRPFPSIKLARWSRAVCIAAAVLLPTDVLQSDAPDELVRAADVDAKLAALPAGDFDARVELAQWAAAHGQPAPADRILRQVLAIDPENVRAYGALIDIASKIPLRVESPVFRAARNLLPPRFVVTETKRYVVLSDADPNWTRTQIERIERAHHQFMRLANRLDLRPLPLQHKLVCVLFSRQDDYAEFARAQDNVTAGWVAGYYSPRHDWIVFYDINSNEDVKHASAKLDRMQDDLTSWMVRAERAEHLGQTAAAEAMRSALFRYHQHFAVEKKKLTDFTERASIATTVHEAVHHLMFHSHVQLRTVEYPLWISEGMATAFETDQPNAAFGPDHEFKPRRDEFIRLLKEDKLIPLRELVTLTAMPNADPDTISAVYHGSYALVTWMCRFRAAEVRDYFERMRREPPGKSTPQRHLEIFQQVFGDVDRLERAWIRYELNRPEFAAAVPWHRRLAAADPLIALADPPGMEQLAFAGVPIYNGLIGQQLALAAAVTSADESADLRASADSAAPGNVTISAARSSTDSPSE